MQIQDLIVPYISHSPSHVIRVKTSRDTFARSRKLVQFKRETQRIFPEDSDRNYMILGSKPREVPRFLAMSSVNNYFAIDCLSLE